MLEENKRKTVDTHSLTRVISPNQRRTYHQNHRISRASLRERREERTVMETRHRTVGNAKLTSKQGLQDPFSERRDPHLSKGILSLVILEEAICFDLKMCDWVGVTSTKCVRPRDHKQKDSGWQRSRNCHISAKQQRTLTPAEPVIVRDQECGHTLVCNSACSSHSCGTCMFALSSLKSKYLES